MATKKFTQPVDAAAKDTPRVDAEDMVNEALALNAMIDWACGARDLIESIRISARIDPKFEAKLSEHRITFNSPSWVGADAGTGMAFLLMRQRDLLTRIARVAHD